MSPSSGAARRSGDPRKRNGRPGEHPAPTGRGPVRDRRAWLVVAAVAVGLAVLGLALAARQPEEGRPRDSQGRLHAEAACDLTGKAGEAAEATSVQARSRYAAAVLLLDRAIIESERAAASDPGLADLDTALQEVHTAGHAGDPDGWQTALDHALAECRTVLD